MLGIEKTKGKDEREVMTVSSATYIPYHEGSSMFVNKKDNWSERSATKADRICRCDSTRESDAKIKSLHYENLSCTAIDIDYWTAIIASMHSSAKNNPT
jgi:hypothetical protein